MYYNNRKNSAFIFFIKFNNIHIIILYLIRILEAIIKHLMSEFSLNYNIMIMQHVIHI